MKKIIWILTLILPLCAGAPNIDSKLISLVRIEARINAYIDNYLKLQKRIESLLFAIKMVESNGNYFSIGNSGEFGAYQFTPKTWKSLCLKYVGKELDIRIPDNQDYIAFLKVKSLIEKGYSDEEIASIWNSGSSVWHRKVGINKFGIPYNVPKYVNKIVKLKNEIHNKL